MSSRIEDIKKLRSISHAGYADCKKALQLSDGDIAKAVKYLREIGHKMSVERGEVESHHGIIECYIHPGNRIGSMVEVRCETDFVAKTEDIKDFAKALAIQVTAMQPKYVSRKDVPVDVISEQENLFSKKSEDGDLNKSVSAKMDRWYAENCLLEQPYVKDLTVSFKDLLSSLIVAVGETCRVTRIQRWEIM